MAAVVWGVGPAVSAAVVTMTAVPLAQSVPLTAKGWRTITGHSMTMPCTPWRCCPLRRALRGQPPPLAPPPPHRLAMKPTVSLGPLTLLRVCHTPGKQRWSTSCSSKLAATAPSPVPSQTATLWTRGLRLSGNHQDQILQLTGKRQLMWLGAVRPVLTVPVGRFTLYRLSYNRSW